MKRSIFQVVLQINQLKTVHFYGDWLHCRSLTTDHTCKKSLSSDNLAAAAAAADADATRRLPASPWRDMENDEYAQFVAGVEEMRVSPVISRRGYLYFLEENATGWTKMWVVSILREHLIFRSSYRDIATNMKQNQL